MSLWAIVPVKPLSEAKRRLAPVLSPDDRLALSRGLLERTLGVLAGAPELAAVLVVSRDAGVLELAERSGAQPLAEAGAADLNQALAQATRAALGRGAGAVLIVPADLPGLAAEDVAGLAARPSAARAVVIAPDRHEAGTNALLVRPPGLIAYAFGEGSFRIHVERAAQAGVRAEVYRSPGLALDVDLPDDLRLCRLGQKI